MQSALQLVNGAAVIGYLAQPRMRWTTARGRRRLTLRGVDKIALVGWSGGGIRTGTFVGRHPEKVDRYVIWASSNYSRKNPSQAPELHAPGAPTTFQTRAVGIDQRWIGSSKCDGAIEPGVPEMVSAFNQQANPLGAT